MIEEKNVETTSLNRIRRLLRETKQDNQKVATRLKTRRQLIVRSSNNVDDNLTGTYLPAPFDKTVLALRSMAGEAAKAVQHYASRIAANDPEFQIAPITSKKEITATLDKTASEEERLLASLWEENGGAKRQWDMGMTMTTGGVGYYITGVRDADFGLPDRRYYDTDEEIELLKREKKITPMKVPHPKTGQWMYAEHGDVWAARRKEAFAQAGNSLFTLEALPRDMVYVGKDGGTDDIKWAAVIEEINGSDCEPGSEAAIDYARQAGVPEDDVALYGIWKDKSGKIIGGVPKGGPPESFGWSSPRVFTKIRFYNRIEMVTLIAKDGVSFDGAVEVYRCKHGATRQGNPVVPVVEVPMMRTNVNVPGEEFTTPMEPVFAYVPLINQLLTVLSNATMFNGIPRWILELTDGSILRGEDGEPVIVDNAPTPGLDPSEAAAYPGTLRQLLIDVSAMQELAAIFFERLDACMPAAAATGEAGSSAAAWQVRLQIQQAQENLRQAVNNHADAVKEIQQMWIGWMRALDLPIYFFSAAGHRSDQRTVRGLIEFDPKDLTDAISVTQSLDSPEEATVRIQQGLELRASGAITWSQFFEEYLRAPDAREAEILMYVQQVVDHVMGGIPAAPGSIIQIVSDGVRGQIHYALMEASPNYAIAQAEQAAAQAQAQLMAQEGAAPTSAESAQVGNVAEAAGVREPGMGMATTIEQTLGTSVPGAMAPANV